MIFMSARSLANLQVYPTRVVLDDRSRISQLTLTHSDKEPVTYEIVPVFYKQDAQGRMISTDGDGASTQAFSAAPLLRYSPRVFSLQAGQTQTIKIRAQPRPALADGIYRIHLRIQPAPLTKPEISSESKKKESKSGVASLELKAMLAIAVPVYFTHGRISRSLDTSDLRLSKDGSKLSFLLKQEGNGFLFGDILVSLKSSQKKDPPQQIGRLLNMASYAPERRVEISLDPPFKKPEGPHGNLRLEINQSPEEGSALIYEKEVPLSSVPSVAI